MSKINPLYVFAFFSFMAVVMMFQSGSLERKISQKAQQNAATQQLGKKIASMKNEWKDSKTALKKIDAVLNLKSLGAKVKSRERQGGSYKVVLAELNAREVDSLFAKLLNETVNVK